MESEYQKAQEKWKEEIGFASMQFPVYKKSPDLKEWHRLDSVHELISLRIKHIRGIGICNELSEATFVEICKWYHPCTADEFNKMFEVLKAHIDKIQLV